MASGWKTVRVFISSTFSDMHAERDHLVRIVFPELKERCRQRHVHLIDIDLRWGVTERDAESGNALDICLDEIDSCRPYFLGILGHRYGFVPEGHAFSITAQEIYHGVLHGGVPKQVLDLRKILEEKSEGQSLSAGQKECLSRSYSWDPDKQKYFLKHDLTPADAHNIRAIFERFSIYQKDRSFFFFRSEALSRRLAGANIADFFDQDQGRLESLKKEIVEAKLPYFEYADVEIFGQLVLDTLWKRIDAETEQVPEERDWLEEEDELHRLFIADRTRRFVGRRELLDRMHHFCREAEPALGKSSRLMVISGEPGCGKSALMARFVEEFVDRNPDVLVISHFMGASPKSTGLSQMLLRFCSRIYRSCDLESIKRERLRQVSDQDEFAAMERDAINKEFEVPANLTDLMVKFPEFLQKTASIRKVVFVIDAINQLEAIDQARLVSWLPENLSENVRFVISTLEGKMREAMLQRSLPPREEIVEGMTISEIRELVERYLKEIRHEFPNRMVEEEFYRRVEKGNPLYILIALEELRVFGRYEALAKRIAGLPDTIPALFDQVLERIESDFTPELVRDCLSFIACGKYGMTRDELQGLLRDHAPAAARSHGQLKLPDMIWARLHRSLSSYLIERLGVIDFFHVQLKEAVGRRYLQAESRRVDFHKAIADYLEGRWREPYARALDELPHQRLKTNEWPRLAGLLTDWEFIELKCSAGMALELAKDYDAALHSKRVPPEVLTDVYDLARFVKAQSDVLSRFAHLTFQQALNEPDFTAPSRMARNRLAAGLTRRPWIRYVNKPQTRSACLMTLVGHTSKVSACAFSPDGSQIISGSSDGTTKLWDASTGIELASLKSRSPGVTACALSRDGTILVSATQDGRLTLWDAKKAKERATLSGSGHRGAVTTCSFLLDGKRFMSYAKDQTMKVWDSSTGALLRESGLRDSEVFFSRDASRFLLVGYGRYKTQDNSLLYDASRGRQLAVLSIPKARGSHLSVSADGRRIAYPQGDSLVILDIFSRTQLTVLTGHSRPVLASAFSWKGDLIVSASEDKTLKLWDVETGKELTTLAGHGDKVQVCAFSPDDSRILSGSADYTLRIWDRSSGRELANLAGRTHPVTAGAFSPDGGRIVSSTDENTLKLWDAKSGEELTTLAGHTATVNACVFSPDGDRILSVSDDTTLRLWDAHEGTQLVVLACHVSEITACEISSDNSRIISKSSEKTLTWDVGKGKLLASSEEKSYHGYARPLARSPDGRRLATGCEDDGSLMIEDAKTGKEVARLFGHKSTVSACAYSPDGRSIVSGSEDGMLKIWDAQVQEQAADIKPHEGAVSVCIFSPDGRKIVTAPHDGCLKIWDIKTGKLLKTLRTESGWFRSTACYYSPDGKKIISQWGPIILVWGAESGELRAALKHSESSDISFAHSPDGSRFITGDDDTIKIWDANTGRLLASHESKGYAFGFVFSPDGSRIACECPEDEKGLKLLEARTGEEIALLARGQGNVIAYSFSGDSKHIVTVVLGETVLKLWDAMTGTELITMTGHSSRVQSCSFSPDGSRIVSGSSDNTLRYWDVKTGDVLLTLESPEGAVLACQFSPDGSIIVSKSGQNKYKLWRVDSGEDIGSLKFNAESWVNSFFSADGRFIFFMIRAEGVLKTWEIEKRKLVSEYHHDSAFTDIDQSPYGTVFAAGDNSGRLLILEPENIPISAPIVTAWEYRFPDKSSWFRKANLSFGCPACRSWPKIHTSALGRLIRCPNCKAGIKLNPFTINADWRGIARAWQESETINIIRQV